jgi:hypothetical protein
MYQQSLDFCFVNIKEILTLCFLQGKYLHKAAVLDLTVRQYHEKGCEIITLNHRLGPK